VNFHFGNVVDEIVQDGGKVKGIKVADAFVQADVVISNIDIWFTYTRLLKDQPGPKNVLKQERSSSALIFYWGINKEFPGLDLHNIFFSEHYEEEFNAIWKRKEIHPDPTIYINVTSKLKKDDAPRGCENWFVMINVPANSGQDWNRLVAEARKHVLLKLSRNLGEDVSSLISCERILDPISIEQNTGSYQGSLYGSSSNSQFSAFLRHANFSSKVKGLYFTGGSVHPGGGIPLALLSAKIVSDLLP
jgi:phytoene desaturase